MDLTRAEYEVAEVVRAVTQSFGGRTIRPSAFQKAFVKEMGDRYEGRRDGFDRQQFYIAAGVNRRVV